MESKIIEINGEKYIERPKTTTSKISPKLAAILGIAMMFDPYLNYGSDKGDNKFTGRPERKINIVKEFELIQQKKSNLSKSERDGVIYHFNLKYKKWEE